MPRVDRLIRKREPRPEPQPISTWTPLALKTELSRLETDHGDLNAWQAFGLKSAIENELHARENKCPA
jgi:hypothetical protein